MFVRLMIRWWCLLSWVLDEVLVDGYNFGVCLFEIGFGVF